MLKAKITKKGKIDQEQLVSIIIPLYNNRRFITKCVQSLQAQTYKNVEIIVVDDRSTDDSLDIVKKLSESDQRVIPVLSSGEKGVSSARNEGIKLAKGEYICFVDSDDYVSATYVESLLTLIKHTGADISAVRYTNVSEKQNKKFKKTFNPDNYNIEVYDKVSAMKQLFCGKKVRMNIWNKMYPRRFFEGENKLRYDPTLKHCEDVCFLYDAFLKAEKVVYLPIKSYAYTKRRGSLVHCRINPDKLTSLVAVKRSAEKCKQELPQAHVHVAGWQALVNVEMLSYMVYDRYFDYASYCDIRKTFKEKMKYVPKGERHYLHRRLLAPLAGALLVGVYKLMFGRKLRACAKAEKQEKAKENDKKSA